MAGSNVNSVNTVLTPEDVPGAQLIYERLEDHTCVQLKRWLACRGLPRTGRKKDLMVRIRNCITLKQDKKIDPAIDGGHWFQIKELKKVNQNSINAGKIDIEKVANLPVPWQPLTKDQIPELYNEGHIYHCLIEKGNVGDEKGDCNTAKPYRRAYQYVKSGYISNVKCYRFQNKLIVSGQVQASMKDIVYTVTIVLSFRSGAVLAAGCAKCKASALGKCSHISGTLVYLNELVKETCTSRPCEWNKGSRKRNPQKLQEAFYGNSEYVLKKTKFDPRATKFQNTSSLNQRVNNLLQNLEISRKGDVCQLQRLLFYSYDDFVLDENEKSVVKKQCTEFINNLYDEAKFQTDPYLVDDTEGQSESSAWKIRRSLIFTASRVKDVLGLTVFGAKNFLRTNLWQLEEFTSEAMRYGLNNENTALQQYKEVLQFFYEDVTVEKTGLWISKEYPFLGGSPDGVVTFRNNRNEYEAGLVEVKCPFLLKGVNPNLFYSVLTSEQLRNFFLTSVNNVTSLKRDHKYYYQIQTNLFIHKLKFCDLVVWSNEGILIERIERDEKFFSPGLLQQLFIKYRSLYVPEYFLQRTVRDLDPIFLTFTY